MLIILATTAIFFKTNYQLYWPVVRMVWQKSEGEMSILQMEWWTKNREWTFLLYELAAQTCCCLSTDVVVYPQLMGCSSSFLAFKELITPTVIKGTLWRVKSFPLPSIFGPRCKKASPGLYVLSLIGPIDSSRTRAVMKKQISLNRIFISGLLKKNLFPLRQNKQPWNNKAELMDNCTLKAGPMSCDSNLQSENLLQFPDSKGKN